jgi:putative DNA primase/helicase
MPQNIVDLIALPEEERTPILGSWFTEGSLNFLYALRGVGKTTIATSMALACAHPCQFLYWTPMRQYSVLYVDSEMGPQDMRRKFLQVDSAMSKSISSKMPITILTQEEYGNTLNISDPKTQAELDRFINTHEIIIFDNFLGLTDTLYPGDNDVTIWKRIQPWLTGWRSKGKTILVLHHTAKSGDQYGTITKENPCDSIVKLEESKEGFVNGFSVNWHITKGRWIYGADKQSLRVSFESIGESQVFKFSTMKEARNAYIMRMIRLGWKSKELASLMGLKLVEIQMVMSGKEDLSSPPSTTIVTEPAAFAAAEFDPDEAF